MILKITTEKTCNRSGAESEIYYVREHPYQPGMSIQMTALSLEGALWQARRISSVTQIIQPPVPQKVNP
jgi:hypothetical protein